MSSGAALAVAALRRAAGPAADRAAGRAAGRADAGVAAAVAGAAVLGALTVLGGIRRLDTIPQSWDGVFHANGVRWVADTGDAGLFGLSRVNWPVEGTEGFYPNAYHLLGAVVHRLTDRDVPSVLNAHTDLLPGLAALVLAAEPTHGGGAWHAGGSAVAITVTTAFYDLLWKGALLPYATVVALTAAVLLLVVELLDAPAARAALPAGALLALGAAGLLCVHSVAPFGVALFAVPLVAARWWGHRDRWRREAPRLALAGAGTAGLGGMQLAGALTHVADSPPLRWPADLTWTAATLQLLTGAAVGLLALPRLGALSWCGWAALAVGVLFVLTASVDSTWVDGLTRPWWNDRWRLAGLFAVPLSLIAGHGVAQAQRCAAELVRRSAPAVRRAVPVTAAAVLAGLAVADDGLGVTRNTVRMAAHTEDRPFTAADRAAVAVLAEIVPPGVRVLNDRRDGSPWMYAVGGVLPLAGHYTDIGLTGTDVELLEQRFRHYADDDAVRAAVARLDIGFVMLGSELVNANRPRSPGLRDLAGLPFLQEVYSAGGAVIYEIVEDASTGTPQG